MTFKRLTLSLLAVCAVVALAAPPIGAQNPTCPTRPVGDKSNACASTAFVGTAGNTAAAGSNTQVQFNNSGIFGASPNLTWVSPALSVGVSGTSGQVKYVSSNSNAVTMQAHPGTNPWTFQLPSTAGSAGNILSTDGAGVTSWSAAGSGSVTSATIAGTTGNIAVSGTCTITTTGTCTVDLAAGRLTGTTTQVFTSGSGTYNRPSNVIRLEVTIVGGGGGGAGSGSGGTGGSGGAGGNTTFSTLTGNGGGGATGNSASPSTGGSASGGYINQAGSNGQGGSTNIGVASVFQWGGHGGSSCLSGGGFPSFGAGTATSPPPNTGGGGGGAGGGNNSLNLGGGGAAGGCVQAIINSPGATFSYAVGAAGTAGAAGTSGAAGAAGSLGVVIVKEYYN